MPMTALYFRHRRPADYGTTVGTTTINRRGTALMRKVLNGAMGNLNGAQGDQDYVVVYTSTEPSFASAVITAATVATTFTATINGVAVQVTPAGGDTASCGLLAAAVNASSNALVQGFVTSNNLSATATLASVVAGTYIDICGYRFTGTSGVPAAIVSGGNYGNFDVSGNDTADAAALAAAVNAMPGLSRFIAAVPVAGVVYLCARQATFSGTTTFTWPSAPGTPPNTLYASAATITLSATALAAAARCNILACTPGVLGNAITIAAAAGSGTAAVLNTETRLNRGTGLNVVPVVDAS